MRTLTESDGSGIGGRAGVALPMTLLMIVVLSCLAASAFTMVGSERRVVDNQESQVESYALARSGMERFLANRAALGFTSAPPAAVESARIVAPTGYVDVVLTRLRPPLGAGAPALYVLRSRGVKTVGRLTGTPIAERTIAQYAQWQSGSMQVLAAWTAMTGLLKSGGSGVVSGVDGCGAAPAVAGVAVPSVPGYTQAGGSSVPNGSPDILDLGTAAQTVGAVAIDWNTIVNGNAWQPDLVIPGSAWPSAAQWADATYWPVIRVNGSYSLPGDGRGTLVVTGDLSVGGSKTWDGIILVGGVLTSSGTSTVNGAVVSA